MTAAPFRLVSVIAKPVKNGRRLGRSSLRKPRHGEHPGGDRDEPGHRQKLPALRVRPPHYGDPRHHHRHEAHGGKADRNCGSEERRAGPDEADEDRLAGERPDGDGERQRLGHGKACLAGERGEADLRRHQHQRGDRERGAHPAQEPAQRRTGGDVGGLVHGAEDFPVAGCRRLAARAPHSLPSRIRPKRPTRQDGGWE